jgi:hypothetical protein
MPKAQVIITREIVPDDSPDPSYLEQDGWQGRLAAYRQGEFGFVGVRAVAEIKIPHGADWIVSRVSSPGLWGIEDDSGEGYFREVFQEERKTLIDMLESLKDFEIIDG